MRELTEKQRAVLMFITDFADENGYPPTMREIAKAYSISPKAAYDFVNALRKKGRLEAGNKGARTLKAPDRKRNGAGLFIKAPLLGEVAAGKCPLPVARNNGFVYVPKALLDAGAEGEEGRDDTERLYFALTVRGNAMNGAGILDGDTALIRKQDTAENGDIVVTELDEGLSLKRYFKENARICLQPDSGAEGPLYYGDIRIAGKLVCVYRTY